MRRMDNGSNLKKGTVLSGDVLHRRVSPAGLSPSSAVGVFDSGIGGLTVVRELLRILPQEPIVYLGDTARVPYGNKSRETVLKFSTENVLFLLHHDVKLVIIACHTASSFALSFLQRHFNHPILGVIEPGVEMALGVTRTGRIGVIGTNATIGSMAYPHAFALSKPFVLRPSSPARPLGSSPGRAGRTARRRVKITQVACPLFVPLVEEGLLSDPLTEQVAARYLKPLKAARVDTLILGCTHYPLLKRTIAKVMGPRVHLVDSAHQVALKAQQVLRQLNLSRADNHGAPARRFTPARRFFVTDEPRHFQSLSVRFLGRRIGDVAKV